MLTKKQRKNGTWEVSYQNPLDETGIPLPSRTVQSSRDECDVNLIIARHKKGIQNTHVNTKQGVYADLSSAPQYHEALQTVIDANSAFETLPSATRKRFGNDPREFLQFMEDPKNYDEGVKLGLYEPKKAQPAIEAISQNNQSQNNQSQNPSPPIPPNSIKT